MLIRPKSMATVVAFFCSTPRTSSTPTLTSVIVSSVVSGLISLTEPTRVVLPTPNPPTTTILTAVAAEAGSASSRAGPTANSEPLESIHHRLEQFGIGDSGGAHRGAHLDRGILEQVGDQDGDHAERQLEVRRDLRHGQGVVAHAQDRRVLRLHLRTGRGPRHHEGDQVEVAAAARGAASAGDDVQALGAALLPGGRGVV